MALQADRTADTTRHDGTMTRFQEDVIASPALRGVLAFGRIVIGFYFFWAFIDKLFGLGFATPAERAWINGGSPTTGYLSNVSGPFADFFSALAGNPIIDWLFMLGLAGIGIAMMLGAGLKIAAVSGVAMVTMMHLAAFPLGQPADVSVTNPIVSSYFLYAIVLIVSAMTLSGDTLGLGRWWGRIVGNSWLR
ncbi:MAG: DoxX family protein [Mobilicoccus sp.]|nr:DoxX family protein [Mobilicoccus sp.]